MKNGQQTSRADTQINTLFTMQFKAYKSVDSHGSQLIPEL
tara:strand:- start:820 stop:939 length:120 start_codon:yes stop_codon:yes gene_type:complete